MRRDQPLRKNARLNFFRPNFFARLQRPYALHQRFFEGAPNGHGLAHGFHLRAQAFIGAGEFFKLPFGNLGDHVVDGRLKARRRHLGDVVGNFVQRVAHSKLGRDLGDREARGL